MSAFFGFFLFPLFLFLKIVGKLDYSIVFEAMADRLTQLQDTVNQQAEHFCNSIGILQQCSVPSKFAGFERTGSQTPQQQVQQQQEDFPQLFSTLISRCAKDIDTLIESLPSEESSIELQVQSLQRLEAENKESAEKLEEIVRKGELLLEKIQAALSDIAQSQLDMQYST
uniref:Mediator of RNA polymerase II transcription subunit 21 n=1 Tax=Anopheles farauti TaxID=69004 RepID=A0A182R0J0_9DIPT